MKNERNHTVTDPIYERDSYIKDFSATVISCEPSTLEINGKRENVYSVILDVTAFFPEGGGQKADSGYIDGSKVLDVVNADGEIIHYLKDAKNVNAQVICNIDFEARYRKMQKHSGEHLFCGLLHSLYGADNVGFHLGDDAVTLDIDKVLSDEELLYCEKRANEIIYENVPITISFPNEEELSNIEYRSKLDITEGVRLVYIGDYDICACCAPHVASTGEIGIIKMIDYMPHRGGMRIILTAGMEAYEDYSMLAAANRKIMAVVSSKRAETSEGVEMLNEKCRSLSDENIRLKKLITDMIMNEINTRLDTRLPGDKAPFLIFSEVLDDVQMRNVINECTRKLDVYVAGFIGNDTSGYKFIVSVSENAANLDLKQLARDMGEKLCGRGGGSNLMISGKLNAKRREIETFFEE